MRRLGGQRLRRNRSPTTARARRWGRVAAGRSAISADGSEVAFVTTAVSDLVAYPKLEEEERGEAKRRSRTRPPGRSRCATSKAAAPCSSAAATSNAGNRPPRGPPNRSSARASSAPSTRGEQFGVPRDLGNGRTAPGASISADGSHRGVDGGADRRAGGGASRRNAQPRRTPNRCGGGSLPARKLPRSG